MVYYSSNFLALLPNSLLFFPAQIYSADKIKLIST